MINIKYKIVRFIAKLLDVPIVSPLLHTINISHNDVVSLDISQMPLDGLVNIDITECNGLKTIRFPKFKLTSIKVSEIEKQIN